MDTPRLRTVLVALYACTGGLLLALNLAGLVIPLRNDAIYAAVPGTGWPDDITLTYEQFRAESPRQQGEADAAYIHRLNDLVNRGMAHRWFEADPDAYRLRVPAWENYLLYAASFARPEAYLRYEFIDADRAMERGAGVCSQAAFVMVDLLERAGIEARVLSLGEHVVAEAVASDGARYIADADYGVVLPHGRRALESDPELLRPYYDAVLEPSFPPETVDRLVEALVGIYGPEGNRIATVRDFHYPGAAAFEAWSYRLKWPLPLALLALAALALRRHYSGSNV